MPNGHTRDDLRTQIIRAHTAYVDSDLARTAARLKRDQLIRDGVASGLSMGSIARDLDVSETGVRWVVARFPVNGHRR